MKKTSCGQTAVNILGLHEIKGNTTEDFHMIEGIRIVSISPDKTSALLEIDLSGRLYGLVVRSKVQGGIAELLDDGITHAMNIIDAMDHARAEKGKVQISIAYPHKPEVETWLVLDDPRDPESFLVGSSANEGDQAPLLKELASRTGVNDESLLVGHLLYLLKHLLDTVIGENVQATFKEISDTVDTLKARHDFIEERRQKAENESQKLVLAWQDKDGELHFIAPIRAAEDYMPGAVSATSIVPSGSKRVN